MDLSAFIHVVDPTKVKVIERERVEGEKKLLESIIGRVVPLLPVSPACFESKLEASVENLCDEDGSVDQGDSAAGGGHDAEIELATVAEDVVAVTAERPRRQRKKRPAVTDASGSSHPPKKLRGRVMELLVGLLLAPFITSSIPTTQSVRVVITLILLSGPISATLVRPKAMTKAVITSHAVNVPFISVPKTGIKITSPNVLNDSLLDDYDVSREFINHLAPLALFSHIHKMDYHHLFTEFNVGTARQACLNAEARDDDIENLKAQLLQKEAKTTKAIRLRAQVSVVEATEKMHVDEINALKQRNVALENEKASLDGKVTELQSLVGAKDLELKDLNVVVSSLKSQNDGLVDQVHVREITCFSLHDQVSGYERLKEQIEELQDAQMNIVNDMMAKLDADWFS
nr:hypothetical protein [Tanacetum cinerariifolium]